MSSPASIPCLSAADVMVGRRGRALAICGVALAVGESPWGGGLGVGVEGEGAPLPLSLSSALCVVAEVCCDPRGPGVCARSDVSAVGWDGGGRVSRPGERALATPAPALCGSSGACAASVASPPHPAFPARLAPRAHASTICLSQLLSHACLSTHGRYSEIVNGSLINQ